MNDPVFSILTVYFFTIIFIIGLCVGSFLNVASIRALKDEEIVITPSHCPKCGKNLKWYHNIPLLSYLFLGGRCAFCKEKISIQYPIVEFINASLYLALFLLYGISLKTIFLCILISFFILIAITDIKERVVFDFHTYPVIVLGLLYNILGIGTCSILESIFGIALGFVFFEGISRVVNLFLAGRAFGEGDTIIAMGIGAFFGWKNLCIVIVMSFILQVMVFIIPMFRGMIKDKKYKKISALLLALVCIILAASSNYLTVIYSTLWGAILFLTFLFSSVIWFARVMWDDMKNKTEEELMATAVPFGPALVISTVILIFYGDIINGFIKNYLATLT